MEPIANDAAKAGRGDDGGGAVTMVGRIKQLREQNSRLRDALGKAFLALNNDKATAVFQIAAVHGFVYKGPVFTKDDYRKATEGGG